MGRVRKERGGKGDTDSTAPRKEYLLTGKRGREEKGGPATPLAASEERGEESARFFRLGYSEWK